MSRLAGLDRRSFTTPALPSSEPVYGIVDDFQNIIPIFKEKTKGMK
jgi:hypothetical protein